MIWFTGYAPGNSQKSIAGPFQEKSEGEATTQGWSDVRSYDLATSDRNVAINEITRMMSGKARQNRPSSEGDALDFNDDDFDFGIEDTGGDEEF